MLRAPRVRAVPTEEAAELPELLPVDDDYIARHSVAPFASWLVPGRLMVGAYPYRNEYNCSSTAEGEARLATALQSGVTAFVSLLGTTPSQSEMPLSGVDGYAPYKAAGDLVAAGMSGPPPAEIVEGLRNPYLDKFIPPRRRGPSQNYSDYKPLRPRYVHWPLMQGDEEDAGKLRPCVLDLRDQIRAGECLYVHCGGGMHRAPTVGACVLVATYGIPAEEAYERALRSLQARKGGEAQLGDQCRETIRQFAL